MTKQLKEIEIPLGAKDSELCGWEYTIPEGMEATIVDNKIVVKKKESGDEKIRKELIQYLKECTNLPSGQYCRADFFDWLEKQGEQKSITIDIDKMVYEFAHTEVKGYGMPAMIEVDAYRKGVNDALYLSLNIEKQGEQKSMNKTECIIYGLKTEFQKQVSYLIASVMNGEHEYTQGYVEWVSQSLLGFAKNEMKYVEWSKKDKEMIEKCLQTINHDRIIHVPKGGDSFHQEEIDWLKSLKGRVQPHNTWKPSEEQIKVCKEVYADLLSAKGFDLGTVNGELNRMEEQLKKLKG